MECTEPLSVTIHWKAVGQYFTLELGLFFFFSFTQFVILDNLSIWDLALSRVKGLNALRKVNGGQRVRY